MNTRVGMKVAVGVRKREFFGSIRIYKIQNIRLITPILSSLQENHFVNGHIEQKALTLTKWIGLLF